MIVFYNKFSFEMDRVKLHLSEYPRECFTKTKINFKFDLTMAGCHATFCSHHLLAFVSQGTYKSWSQIFRIYIF